MTDNSIKSDNILTVKSLSEKYDIPVATIYVLTHQKRIPYYKFGRKLYFKKEEIEECIFSNRIRTKEEIEKIVLHKTF